MRFIKRNDKRKNATARGSMVVHIGTLNRNRINLRRERAKTFHNKKNYIFFFVQEFSCQEVRDSSDDMVIFFATNSDMRRFLSILESMWQTKNVSRSLKSKIPFYLPQKKTKNKTI